jgi:hypothetical protein
MNKPWSFYSGFEPAHRLDFSRQATVGFLHSPDGIPWRFRAAGIPDANGCKAGTVPNFGN